MLAWQLVCIQVVTFIALVVALRMLFARQLNAALQRLQSLQEEAMVKEAQLREELERAKQERIAEAEKGREEAKALLEAAQRSVETLRANAEEQAKQDSQKLLAKGKEEVETMRASLSSQIETGAVALSTQMIQYALTQRNTEEFQRHILEELIQDIEALGKDRFPVQATTALVISSAPLTTEAQHRLRQVLSEKLETDVTLDARVDPALITGLVVQVGSLVIDGSLKNKLRKVLTVLRSVR